MTANRRRALRRQLRTAGLLAAALLLAGPTLSAGALCLGDDGHVAFELTLAGKCFDDVAGRSVPSGPQGLSARGPGSDCGPCTDLGTASGAWLGKGTPDLPDAPAVALAVQAPALCAAACPNPRHVPGAPMAARAAALAATVLRC